ncbi:MAG: BrnT family toxin [Chloroflexota bacterium]
MKVRHTLHNIAFEWDSRKAVSNFRKHGVSFELACEAFFDPFVHYLDDEIIEGELRETVIGLTTTWQLLYVVYILRDDIIRIISARLVTKAERESYENQ